MSRCSVTFYPQNRIVKVKKGSTLLEAASAAHITINNLCGGDGICGRCKMIIKSGEITGKVTGKLTREEIKKGYVLACMSYVENDLTVEIPAETLAKEKVLADEDAERFRSFEQELLYREKYKPSPLVTKLYLELEKPTLANNQADHLRICEAVSKKLKYRAMQMGLKIIQSLPETLRKNNYRVTATVGLRKDIAEVMNVEAGNTEDRNYMVVVDMGTTTIVAHLVDAKTTRTIDAEACFNSQGIYGREVTTRIINAEKKGTEELQRLLVGDINRLIEGLAVANRISPRDITAVVCAGNTAMSHFLLALPTQHIRRFPYVPTSVDPPPLRAAEVGIRINPRGLLYSLPGISGWVGSDITAGILATGINENDEISVLVDIGTNGEVIVGSRDWLIACSASAGPALEGVGENCGMRAEKGAIEKVYAEDGAIRYETIGGTPPRGICGSGIIDLVSVFLDEEIIDRSGHFAQAVKDRLFDVKGIDRYVVVPEGETYNGKPIFFSESDIENVVTAKAAIFAAMKILLRRVELQFSDIQHFYIAGAFGNYINVENAINIGLIPDIARERIEFVGNTSIKGAKIAAFYKEAFYKIMKIQKNTTYYDLMGANDYVEEFKKALFLPHTDIELFRRQEHWQEQKA
jgi:uncharacterized 2Fe-2S/4Fe-4S cluster protein (DUF4445 family)